VIIIFVGFFVFGVIVTPLLSENFSLRFFVPSDNPLITTFDIADNEFNNKNGISVDIMMDHRKPNNEAYLHSDLTRAEVPKIQEKFLNFEWTIKDTMLSPLKNFTEYIHEAEDGFPLSPLLFEVEDTPSRSALLNRTRIVLVPGPGPGRSFTVYPDTRAEDCDKDGTLLEFCPDTEADKRGGISSGMWPTLKQAKYITNHDKLDKELAVFKDTKLFYDALHHWIGTPQGAGMRGFLSLHDWYQNFTEWIEWLPVEENKLEDGLVLDKRMELDQGMLNDVNNNTRRPKNAEKFCKVLKYFLKTKDPKKVGEFNNGTWLENPELAPELDESATCYPKGGDIKYSRMNAEMKCKLELGEKCETANSTQEVAVMAGIRDAIGSLNSEIKPTPYSFTWLFTEQYSIVRQEAYTNIILAVVAVFIITIFFLNHIWCALLVTINVTMVLIDVVALMWLWDLSVNSVSIVNLVLAIGLAVDYSAHVAHAFMSATGTLNERACKAMQEMGSDVIHGACSTFLAVLVLSTSKSYIFVAMFQQFFGICVFGALHGLLLLPVVLSLIGPPTNKVEEDWQKEAPGTLTPPAALETIDVQHSLQDKAPVAVNAMVGNSDPLGGPQAVTVPNTDVGPVQH